MLVIEKIKDAARLAVGLDERNRLTETAISRALDVLSRFGQRLRHIPTANVRVVGTNTLRKARMSSSPGPTRSSATTSRSFPAGKRRA